MFLSCSVYGARSQNPLLCVCMSALSHQLVFLFIIASRSPCYNNAAQANCLNCDVVFVMATLTMLVFSNQIQIACKPHALGSNFVAQYAAQITAEVRCGSLLASMFITTQKTQLFFF